MAGDRVKSGFRIRSQYYRGYHIQHNPKPVPWRGDDWDFWHEDYGGPGDDRHGTAGTGAACVQAIDEQLAEEAADLATELTAGITRRLQEQIDALTKRLDVLEGKE